MDVNFILISAIYGDSLLNKMNGCKFHFNQSVQRQMRILDEPHYSTFLSLANDLLYATTPEPYNKTNDDFYLFLTSNDETRGLVSWLQWWNNRKNLMFSAFTSIDAPFSNLAEAVHAGWKNSHEINLSVLNCTYSDVKNSLLLSQHLKEVQSGDYDGGSGPSQHIRLKRKLERDIQIAGRIGRDLVDFNVDMALTPTMVSRTSSLGEEAGCEPPKKITSKTKLFSNRLESARTLKYTMKVANIVNVNAEHRLFEISSSESGRSCYQVRICSQPSCSCPDFGKQGSKIFCKHILFVLMFVLDVSDVNVLDTLTFETEEIVHILHKTDVDPQFKTK